MEYLLGRCLHLMPIGVMRTITEALLATCRERSIGVGADELSEVVQLAASSVAPTANRDARLIAAWAAWQAAAQREDRKGCNGGWRCSGILVPFLLQLHTTQAARLGAEVTALYREALQSGPQLSAMPSASRNPSQPSYEMQR